jgi:hypothetical protein
MAELMVFYENVASTYPGTTYVGDWKNVDGIHVAVPNKSI